MQTIVKDQKARALKDLTLSVPKNASLRACDFNDSLRRRRKLPPPLKLLPTSPRNFRRENEEKPFMKLFLCRASL